MKNVLLATIAIAMLAGCRSGLDTGYKVKKLGVTPEERRGYYAPAFSPESAAAGAASQSPSQHRRP